MILRPLLELQSRRKPIVRSVNRKAYRFAAPLAVAVSSLLFVQVRKVRQKLVPSRLKRSGESCVKPTFRDGCLIVENSSLLQSNWEAEEVSLVLKTGHLEESWICGGDSDKVIFVSSRVYRL